jgi:hypothetical protein
LAARTGSAVLACGLALAALGLACKSRSPFSRSPAALALDEPCRYMGTFHKESRMRLEALRSCEAISEPEWSCLTSALKGLDRDFTQRCRAGDVELEEILEDQTVRYAGCLAPAAAEAASCAALSDDWICVEAQCEAVP